MGNSARSATSSATRRPSGNGRGPATGAVGAFVDITGLKRAEAGRAAAWTFAHLTLDALCDEVCVLDEKGTILFTNTAWRAFAAANHGHAGDRSWRGRAISTSAGPPRDPGPEAAPAFSQKLRALLDGEIPSFSLEYDCHSPDEKRWFVAHAARFLEAGSPRVVIAHKNITDRRRIEEELREREAQLRGLLRVPRRRRGHPGRRTRGSWT